WRRSDYASAICSARDYQIEREQAKKPCHQEHSGHGFEEIGITITPQLRWHLPCLFAWYFLLPLFWRVFEFFVFVWPLPLQYLPQIIYLLSLSGWQTFSLSLRFCTRPVRWQTYRK